MTPKERERELENASDGEGSAGSGHVVAGSIWLSQIGAGKILVAAMR